MIALAHPVAEGPRRRGRRGARRGPGRRRQEPAGPRADQRRARPTATSSCTASACPTTRCRWRRCGPPSSGTCAPSTSCRRPSATVAVDRLRRAAGRGGPLLRPLSPLLADAGAGARPRREGPARAVHQRRRGVPGRIWPTSGRARSCTSTTCSGSTAPTRRVLQQVAARLTGAPLLLIATGRDDADSRPRAGAGSGPTWARRSTPGSAGAARRGRPWPSWSRCTWAAYAVAARVTDELVARVGGNPFTVVEYVRAVIDAGLLTPVLGRLAARPGRARPARTVRRRPRPGAAAHRRPRRGEPPAAGGRRGDRPAVPRPTWSAAVCDVDAAAGAATRSPRPSPAGWSPPSGAGRVPVPARPDPGGAAGRAGPADAAPAAPAHRRGAGRRRPGRPALRVRDRPALRAGRDRPHPGEGLRQRPGRRPAGAGRARAGRGAGLPGGRRRGRRRRRPHPGRRLSTWRSASSCAAYRPVRRGPRAPRPGAARRTGPAAPGRLLAQIAWVHTERLGSGPGLRRRPPRAGRAGPAAAAQPVRAGRDDAGLVRRSGCWSASPRSASAPPGAERRERYRLQADPLRPRRVRLDDADAPAACGPSCPSARCT